jgi:hypothetical protein
MSAELMQFDSFKADVEALTEVMAVDELRFIGGEPLLNPDLMRFLEYANSSPLSRKVSLVTNGVLLPKAPADMWKLLDEVIISRYPGVVFRLTEDKLAELRRAYGTHIAFREKPEFQLVMLNSLNKNTALVKSIFDQCLITHVWQCHTVHNGWYYKCPLPMYIEERLAKIGVALSSKRIDGIEIHGNVDLKTKLQAYLEDRTPLVACRGCLGTSGKTVPSSQLSNIGITAELAEDHSDILSLLAPNFIWGGRTGGV